MKRNHSAIVLILSFLTVLAGGARAQNLWPNCPGNTSSVGIGTTTPSRLLHLSASPATVGLLLDNGLPIRQKNVAGVARNLTHFGQM